MSSSSSSWFLWAAPWSRPLARPLTVGSVAGQSTRDGLLIAVEQGGRCGIADAAPLPGLSTESIDDVLDGLRRFAGLSWSTLQDPFELQGLLPGLPSLAWALSAAAAESLEPWSRPTVASAVLVDDGDVPGAMPESATIKLKVGRRSLDDDLKTVLAWRQQQPSARLRLDGNRRLSVGATVAIAEAAGAALAFFEEPTPLAEAASLPAWLPLALDETLDDEATCADALAGLHRAVAWVVKPTVLGPWQTATIISRARSMGVDVVISSAFDSSVGRRSLVRLAAAAAPTMVHGLGTRRALGRDLDVRGGAVVIEVDGQATVGDPVGRQDLVGVSFERVR